MVLSVDNGAVKLPQLTLSVNEIPAKSSNGSPDDHGHLALSTPTSAATSSGFDTDIEGLKPMQSSDHLRNSSVSGDRFDTDSSVWPGQAHWREKARAAERKNRSCRCLAGLSRRTRIVVKISIVLLVVGVAVGVGFGISKSLGARVWRPEDDRR